MKIISPQLIVDAIFTSSDVPEADYAAYSALTTYALGNRVIVIGADVHEIFESLANANLGNPVTDTTKWLDVGKTNRWKMFDGTVTSQTTKADSINVVLAPVGIVDAIALMNMSASSARVVVTDALEGVVYDVTIDLTSSSGIMDWYAYFFTPIIRVADLVLTDLPPYANPSIAVTISALGETVACGALILGKFFDIGETQYGAKVGIIDYSVKTVDAFGNYTILERAFSKRGTFDLLVDNTAIDALHEFLTSRRAIATVYAGAETYASTFVYGFYRNFDINIVYPSKSICSLEIEGLT